MDWRFQIFAGLLVMATIAPSQAKAARHMKKDVDPNILTLELFWANATPNAKRNCESIGENLMRGKAIWGLGLFDQYRCHQNLETVPETWRWMAIVWEDQKGLSITLKYRNAARKQITIKSSKIRLLQSLDSLTEDNRKVVSRLAATAFLLNLPWQRVLSPTEIKEKKFEHTPDDWRFLALFSIPQTLTHYHTNPRNLKSRFLGRWRLDPLKNETGIIWTTRKRSRHREFGFLVVPERKAIATKIENFLTERKAVLALIEGDLTKTVADLRSELLGGITRGFVGYEHGVSLISDSRSPLSKAIFMKWFGEFRGGLLSGVRIAYDSIPEVSSINSANVKETFQLRRIYLGNGIVKSFLQGMFNVEIHPKIGRYDVEAVFDLGLRDAEDQPIPVTFDVSGTPAVGIDLGLEFTIYEISTSVCYRTEFTNKVFGESLRQSASSTQYAAKVLCPLPGISIAGVEIDIGLHASINQEKIYLVTEATEFQDQKSEIDIDLPYATFGLSLVWR